MYSLFAPVSNQNDENRVTVKPAEGAVAEKITLDTLRHFSKKRMTLSITTASGRAVVLQKNGVAIASKISTGKQMVLSDVNLYNGRNVLALWTIKANGSIELVDSFTVVLQSVRTKILSRPVYSVGHRSGMLALTFDGGSSNKGTEQILDILKKEKLRCTMFLTGRFVQHFPHLVDRILADGHEIANHSYNHPHLTNLEIDGSNTLRPYVDRAYIHRQLVTTDSIFFKGFGQHMKPYWRAPFGEINPQILRWAAELGFRHIGWSAQCDSWDWVADTTSKLYRSPAEIEVHFLAVESEKGLSGKIILMHLSSKRSLGFPYESLAAMIHDLRNRGYRFVKISELLQPQSL